MTHEERVREIRREVMCASVSVTCERICKLEEFVRDLLICIRHDECEESCPYYEEPVEYGPYIGSNGAMYYECSTCCTVGLENCNSALGNLRRAKELGIEVPS